MTRQMNDDGTWFDDGQGGGTNAAPVPATPGATPTNADGSTAGSDVFAGSTFGGDANVGGTDLANWSKETDPRDFMYGRDPNYAVNSAAAERANAKAAQDDLYKQAGNAINTGAQMGQQIGGYAQQAGQQISGYGQQVGSTLGGMAQTAFGQGSAMQNRAGPTADYQGANSVYQVAKNDASQLANMQQGPSQAQAQLQSGLNQAQASNLALARSGRGFGGSASALTQAVGQNAAAGQQAANTSAQLSAQEQQAWNAQHASNLANAAGISTNVGGAMQQQGLSQAQLQQQTIAQNDAAQQALMGQGLQAYNAAGQLGLSGLTSGGQLGVTGLTSGAGITQAGQTLGMQGSQAATGAYAQGEQMAGINMSAQQQADLNREQGLLQNRGIDAGVALSNQAAVNSGWGTAASTAAAIGGVGLAAASDATAKTGIKPLDAGPGQPQQPQQPTPVASSAPPPQAPKAPSLVGPALQAGGALAGGAIGTVIAPGAGTAIGGIAGSALGKLAGGLLSSDIHTKADAAPLDAGAPGGMGAYGQVNPTGSTQAGASNAFSAGRDAAAKSEMRAGADADLKAQAKGAAIQSMLGSASQSLKGFGAGGGTGTLDEFSAMGHPQQAPAYGMQPMQAWGQMQPGMVTSDEHSKTAIRALAKENRALKAAASGDGPTPEMLNQAAADQDAYYGKISYSPATYAPAPTLSQLNQQAAIQDSAGGRIAYPASSSAPTMAMLNQAAADQDDEPIPYEQVAHYTSDEDEKSGVHRSDALDMVDEAPGYSYFYKDPARHGQGQKFGPMAQDLLKTPAGASTVERAPDGTLAVNTGRLALAEHAALHSHRLEFNQLKAEVEALKKKAG